MRLILTYLCLFLAGLTCYGQDSSSVAMLEDTSRSELSSITPFDLNAVVNKDGEVYLRWECSSHPKMLGYKVFVSENPNGKFSEFVKGITSETEATEYVEQGAERKTYYFKVVSIDSTLVQSPYSNVTTIESYDIVPPKTPEFTSLDVLQKGLLLTWTPPEDKDIEKYIIERTDNMVPTPVNFEIVSNGQYSFMDDMVERGRWYTYSILAVDYEGNISGPSREMKAFAEDMAPKDGAHNVEVVRGHGEDLELKVSWTVKNSTVFKYEIYRSINHKGYELYTKILAGNNFFIDAKVKDKKTYGYQIRAIYSDGTLSPLSNEAIIDLKESK